MLRTTRATLAYYIDGEKVTYLADLSEAGLARVIQVMDDMEGVDEADV